MTGCASRRDQPGQVLLEPVLYRGLARGPDRVDGVLFLGEVAQVVPLAAVLEPRRPLAVRRVPRDAGRAAGARAGEGSGPNDER